MFRFPDVTTPATGGTTSGCIMPFDNIHLMERSRTPMHAFPVAVIFCIIAASLTVAGCTSPSATAGPATNTSKTAEMPAVAGQPGAFTGAVPAIPATVDEATGSRFANLTRFVKEAAAYAEEHGKEAALREFNDPKGTFSRGERYIFAYDMNGTTLALPYQQGLLGTDRSALSDANGVEFIRGLADVARDGGGSLYYIYPNPEDNNREEFKISSVLPVGSGWFVGSGIYLPEVPAVFNTTERDNLVDRVKQARRYAQEEGTKKAIADFNDRNGTFADGSRYIFAYAYNGTTLALPFQPDLIGTNRMNFSDINGVKITAWEIAVAKRGGGFVYVNYLNPESGASGLKLCYVAPADGDWLVGSGIYTRQG